MILFLLASVFEVSPDSLDSALTDAGRNRQELERALAEAGELREQASWLIVSMPHLDRLQITAECLLNHIRLANESRGPFPDTIFRDYLLSYRIWDEPCEDWRGPLRDAFSDCGRPRDIKKRIEKAVKLDTTRYFFGPFPSPLTTLSRGRGSRMERAVLLVAALRARGFPARLARCPSPLSVWVEYYDRGAWHPIYFEKPKGLSVVLVQKGFAWAQATPRYLRTGTLRLCFTLFGEPDTSFEGFSVQRRETWEWEGLDDLWWPMEDGSWPKNGDFWVFCLAPGDYILTWGRRNAKGEPFVQVKEFKIRSGEELSLVLETGIPAEEVKPGDIMARPIDSLPRLRLCDGRTLNDLLQYPALVAFLGDDEGSYRTQRQIEGLELNVYPIRVGAGDGICVSLDSLRAALGSEKLPSVMLLDELGKPILWTEGFCEGLPLYIRALLRDRVR
ncbi:MAG: transglutaminase domain-containing protein [candidate division WOR-3 bacterium]